MKTSARFFAWAVAGLCLCATSAFSAEPGLSSSDRILQNELKQQQIRATTQRVGEQLAAVIAEFERNAIGGSEVMTLKRIQSVLGSLTEKDMQTVIEFLQQARAPGDPTASNRNATEAFTKQKVIIIQLEQLVLDYKRQTELYGIALRLKELARQQSENMRLGVWLYDQTRSRNLDAFSEDQKVALQLQHSDQGTLKEKEGMELANLEHLAKQYADGPLSDRPKVALQQAGDGGLKPALESALVELQAGKLLGATGQEKKARDQMREVARLLMISKDSVEILRQALREVEQAISDQKEVTEQTRKLEKETTADTERKQAEVADNTDLVHRDLDGIAPVAAEKLKEAFNTMQDARTVLREQGKRSEDKRKETAPLQARAQEGLEQAKRALEAQLAKALENQAKPEDKLAAMKELQEQVKELIKAQEQVKQETAANETKKAELQKDAPKQGELKDQAQDLEQKAAEKSTPASQSLGEAAAQMQKAQKSLAEAKNNPAAQQAALDALNQAEQQLSQDIARLEQAQKDLAQLEEMLKKLGNIINDEQKTQLDTAKAALKQTTPPTQDLAAKQDKLAKATGELKKEAETPVPAAASHLDQAKEKMDAAKGNLEANQPKAAQPQQTQALSELQAAKKEIETRADQLRDQLGQPKNDNAQALADAAAAIEQAQKEVGQALSDLQQGQPGLMESLQQQQKQIADALGEMNQNGKDAKPVGEAQKAAAQAAQQLAKHDLPAAIGEMKKAQSALKQTAQPGEKGQKGEQAGQGQKGAEGQPGEQGQPGNEGQKGQGEGKGKGEAPPSLGELSQQQAKVQAAAEALMTAQQATPAAALDQAAQNLTEAAGAISPVTAGQAGALPAAAQAALQNAQSALANGAAQAAAGQGSPAQANAAAASQALSQAQAALALAQAGLSSDSAMAKAQGQGQQGQQGQGQGQGQGKGQGQSQAQGKGQAQGQGQGEGEGEGQGQPGQQGSGRQGNWAGPAKGATDGPRRTVAGPGQFTTLPKRDRAAIQQSQSEKYPQEYGPLVEQYLKNLSDQTGNK